MAFEQGTVSRKEYVPLELFSRNSKEKSVYQVIRSKSTIDDSMEYYLSFTYPVEADEPVPETLSLTITYTNGEIVDRLHPGDICRQTSESPGLLEFQNIMKPTGTLNPAMGKGVLWKFLSQMSLNYLSLANVDSFKNLLELYVFPENKDRQKLAANQKRIEGILDVNVAPADRIVNGIMMRGQKISITLNQDQFACLGDLYMFSSVLDVLFGIFSSINTFTQFEVKETISGEVFHWPIRTGTRMLI